MIETCTWRRPTDLLNTGSDPYAPRKARKALGRERQIIVSVSIAKLHCPLSASALGSQDELKDRREYVLGKNIRAWNMALCTIRLRNPGLMGGTQPTSILLCSRRL